MHETAHTVCVATAYSWRFHCTSWKLESSCSNTLYLRLLLWVFLSSIQSSILVQWPKSPAEQSIHQQESGQLQASVSTYTTSDALKPSLPFHSCHFLCSLGPRPLPFWSNLWLHFCFFSPSHFFFFSLDCCPSFPSGTITLPFPPSRVWAVKQEQAHGRPLTDRPSALELSCRTKLQTADFYTIVGNIWQTFVIQKKALHLKMYE